MNMSEHIPKEVQKAYAHLGEWLDIKPLYMGLINKTYIFRTDSLKYVAQEVSAIFDVTIHDDCERVSKYLIKKGIIAPILIPTTEEKLFYRYDNKIFRVLSFIDGQCFNKIQSLKMAEQAGRMVGRFHQAVFDLRYDYRSKRRHGGDYGFHLSNLTLALKSHPDHDYFHKVEPLALCMIDLMKELTLNLSTTPRHAHGDPKISNILFNKDDEAICMVDFDTLGQHGWSLEMGDALRSWCNPNAEDELSAHVDLKIAEAALGGYGQEMRGMLTSKELSELSIHAPAISLCVAIRYLTDVLNEKFWAYDKTRFNRAAEHNWIRAQAMYELAKDFVRHGPVLKDLIMSLLL